MLCIMTAGYAAFQTNLNITAKGNILEKGITLQELKEKYCNTQSGDGLYKDTYESGRCIYKGANPNNYITFNDELWRIISIDSNGNLKLLKNDDIGIIKYDTLGNRTTGYCSGSLAAEYGCNAWMIVSMLTNNVASGAVDKDAELNTYLNNEYYNTLSDMAKELVVNHDWNVGFVSYKSNNLSEQIVSEKRIKWNGKIALPTASEYILTSTNTNCVNLDSYYFTSDGSCWKNSETHNWMYKVLTKNSNHLGWLISITDHTVYGVWSVNGQTNREGALDYSYARGTSRLSVSPTLYINSNIKLTGQGTEEKPYKIKQN